MQKYIKIILPLFLGLMIANIAQAKDGNFIRTEKNIVGLVFIGENEVGVLEIASRLTWPSNNAWRNDTFFLANSPEDQAKIRAIASNTNINEVRDALKNLSELGSNNNWNDPATLKIWGYDGSPFSSFQSSLSAVKNSEWVINISLGASYLPKAQIDFSGLEKAMSQYRKAPADQKGNYLFFRAKDRSADTEVILFVPYYTE